MLARSHIALIVTTIALLCVAQVVMAGSATEWESIIGPNEPLGGFAFGAWPGYQDGYDGLPLSTSWNRAGVHMLLFRNNGTDWSGPSGFYGGDFESPIADGGSKTWGDIRLWSYDYTPILEDRTGILCTWGTSATRPPVGYTGVLTLDYVPTSLNWTGPTEFVINLREGAGFYLPCPIADDPFNPENVTRMHLTVYTYPVPEPSSLAGIGFALASVGAGALRRRRK